MGFAAKNILTGSSMMITEVLNQIPIYEELLLLGDFNARVDTDHNTWLDC